MKSIMSNVCSSLKIKNSNFITCLFYVEDIKDVLRYLKDVREKYPKATHYCYSYILSGASKFSDDHEPSGTAGLPIFNVLTQNGLTNILAVVVRYFGGIKLGAGGLVRAYTNSVVNALSFCNIVDIVLGVKVKVKLNYNEVDNFTYLVRDYNIISKVYGEKIYFTVLIDKDNLGLISNYDYEVLGCANIKKKS